MRRLGEDAVGTDILSVLTPDLLAPGETNPLAHCYVASEAYYWIRGRKLSGLVPTRVRHEGGTHWFLRHRDTGRIIDLTADQFTTPVPYEQGVGAGFLPVKGGPSARTREVLRRIKAARA